MDKKSLEYIKELSRSNNLLVFKIIQDINMDNLPSAQKEFAELTQSVQIHNILFDLSAVERADTAGIAALIELIRLMKIKHIKGQVGLVGLSKNLEPLLMVTKASCVFKIFSSENEAVRELDKP